MLKLAARNIFRHKGRTALTLGAIAFGVIGLILSGGFVEDVFVQLRESTIHSQLGHLQLYRAGYYEHGRRQPYRYMIAEPAQSAALLSALPHVASVMRRLNFSGLLNNGRADLPVIGEGVEPDKEAALATFMSIIAGRQLESGDVYGILVGEGVAAGLKLAPGDWLTLLVTTPDGAYNSLEFELVGVFRTISREYDARAVRVPLATAAELLATPAVHSLVVALDDAQATDAVARSVRQRISAADYELKTWYELADFYAKTVALYQRQFGVLQAIVLVMVLLSVANSVNMAIHERTGEYGTLMALGNSGRDVLRLIVVEHALLGALGAAGGVALGIGLAWAISKIGIPMPPPPNMNAGYLAAIRATPAIVAPAFLIGWLATVLAALLPARRAARLPVVDALRENI